MGRSGGGGGSLRKSFWRESRVEFFSFACEPLQNFFFRQTVGTTVKKGGGEGWFMGPPGWGQSPLPPTIQWVLGWRWPQEECSQGFASRIFLDPADAKKSNIENPQKPQASRHFFFLQCEAPPGGGMALGVTRSRYA